MQSSTFTTNGFNNRKWESTAFEATNSQLVELLHSTKSVQHRKPRNHKMAFKTPGNSQERDSQSNTKTIVNLLNPQFDLFDGLYSSSVGRNMNKTNDDRPTASMVNVGDVVEEMDN